SATPYLISLGRGFITLIPLTEGECDAESPQDVTADGPGIQPHHCVITNSAGVIILHPNGNMCHLDGVPVTKPTKLTHGCTLCLGKSFFHFNHPEEANHMKNMLPEKTAGPALSLSTESRTRNPKVVGSSLVAGIVGPGAAAKKWLPTAPGVCSRCVVCVWDKCRALIPSMGHHTWPHVTSLS
uniref:FHA domain-containing protein n=1 Tax=Sinocyclocheilus anshuiensis TaxID=1608454 RepID=A0A671PHR1_9TELE